MILILCPSPFPPTSAPFRLWLPRDFLRYLIEMDLAFGWVEVQGGRFRPWH